MAKNIIRVLVVEDSALARRVIREALESSPFIEVVADAISAEDALRSVMKIQPDVVTVDLTLRQSSGTALLTALKRMKIPAIVVSSEDSPAIIEQVLKIGAAAFIPKPQGAADLTSFKTQLVSAVKQAAAKARPAMDG